MLARRLAERGAFAAFYRVDDCHLHIQAADAQTLRQIDELVSGWRFARAVATSPLRADYAIRIKRGLPPSVPPQLRAFAVPYGWCHTDEERFYFSIGGSLLIIHTLAARASEIWLNEIAAATSAPTLSQLFSYAIQAALRRCGLYEFHAAGLMPPARDGGALIVGHSGSGKSTISLRLALSGWRYLSDDTLLLKQTDGGVEAQGFRRAFLVAGSALAACRSERLQTALRGAVAPEPDKWLIEPETLFPAQFVAACSPRALFFSALSHKARSQVNELSPRAALTRLIELRPWACADTPVGRGHIETLARLAKQAASYSLLAGFDLLHEPELAAEIISTRMR